MKILKTVLLLTVVNIAVVLGWAMILNPLLPFASLLLLPLYSIIPENVISRDKLYSDILPLLIAPVLLIVNFIIINKSALISTESRIKYYLFNFVLSLIPILLGLLVMFGPIISSESMLKNSVVGNIEVTGEPSFILEEYRQSGGFGYVVEFPVSVNASFKSEWLPNYFDINIVTADNQNVMDNIGCKLSKPFLDYANLQLKVLEKTPPGKYVFKFTYSSEDRSCTADNFNILTGNMVELRDITDSKPKVIKSFSITPYTTKVFQ